MKAQTLRSTAPTREVAVLTQPRSSAPKQYLGPKKPHLPMTRGGGLTGQGTRAEKAPIHTGETAVLS